MTPPLAPYVGSAEYCYAQSAVRRVEMTLHTDDAWPRCYEDDAVDAAVDDGGRNDGIVVTRLHRLLRDASTLRR